MNTIQKIQSLVSSEVDREIDRLCRKAPRNLYEPVAYALSVGGKRLRPSMVLLAHNLFDENIREALPVALAVEIFHNFTLLHDDIMDRAEMRRNHPSVYKKYSENIAILSGDAMSIMAYEYLGKSRSPGFPGMLSLFSQTALAVCEGQQYDMDFESRQDVSIDEYLEMIKLKTAVLLAASLKMGALSANAPDKMADQLYYFGLNLGIAFQLQDDLLDVFADQEKFGKKIGGDIVSNKKTFLLLKAFETSGPETKAVLTDWVNLEKFDVQEKITAITNIYNQLDIKGVTEKEIEYFYHRSLTNLDEIDLPVEKKSEMYRLAKQIMNRDY